MTRILVISDLHIGAGSLDDCDHHLEQQLLDFFAWILKECSPVELVINGDFLDFVQADPWAGSDLESKTLSEIPLCFTEVQSERKIEAILKAHPNIFESLSNILNGNKNNRLVILPGNHDADFFWPSVRARFIEAVCGNEKLLSNRINFHLEQVYRPAISPSIWIEHGHQRDPINAFLVAQIDDWGMVDGPPKAYWSANEPPIFSDVNGLRRLYECIGTRFLIKFLNGLDADYPFVDNVKPFSRFLKIFGDSVTVPQYGFTKVAISVWSMLRFLSERFAHSPSDLLSKKEDARIDACSLVQASVSHMSKVKQNDFVKKLQTNGFQIDSPLDFFVRTPENTLKLFEFLANHLDLANDMSINESGLLARHGNSGTLSLAKGFQLDETAELKKVAKDIVASEEAEFVIMGHTHQSVDDKYYLNSGCWTRFYTFDSTDKTPSWEILRKDSFVKFPYELNYIEIMQNRTPKAQLCNFRKKPA